MSFSWSDSSARSRSRPSARPAAASEPSQKVRPTTAACCTSRRSKGSSASSRAASTACTVSGSSAGLRRPPRRSGAPSPRRTAGCRPSAPPPRARPRRRPGSSAATSSRCRAAVERLEQQLRGGPAPAAPARPPVEQLVAREADQHQRRPHPLREVLDRVEHAVVGPVDVLERDHQRPPRGDRLDARAKRREERFAQALGILAPPARARPAPPARAGDRSVRPALGLLAVSPPLAAEELADVVARACSRPARRSRCRRFRTRRAAPRRAPRRRCRCRREGSARCGRSGVAGARRARRSNSRSTRDLPTPASPISVTRCGARLAHDALVERLERGELVVAAHQRRLARRRRPPYRRARRSGPRPPRRDRLRLALQLERLEPS